MRRDAQVLHHNPFTLARARPWPRTAAQAFIRDACASLCPGWGCLLRLSDARAQAVATASTLQVTCLLRTRRSLSLRGLFDYLQTVPLGKCVSARACSDKRCTTSSGARNALSRRARHLDFDRYVRPLLCVRWSTAKGLERLFCQGTTSDGPLTLALTTYTYVGGQE